MIRLFMLCIPALVQAQTPPATTITATPAALNFPYQLGANAKLPAAQTISLKTNAASLIATVTVSGDLPSNGDWLEPSIRRGSTIKLPASLLIYVTPTGLAAGSYSATILLSGTDSGGAPVAQTIAVTLAISPAPSQLDVSPATLPAFNYVTGGAVPASRQFILYSEGSPMSVTVSVTGAPWLKLNPTGTVQLGGLTKAIVATVDPTELAKLAPKTYSANIAIAAPAATNKLISYPVTLNVNAAVPVVSDTWPDSVVSVPAGTGSTAVVINGSNFFPTSTVAAAGFTSSSVVTVTDSTATPLTASETISIPVYSATAQGLRLTLGSPLPTGFTGTAYGQNLSSYVAGGTAPYSWSATGLAGSGLTLTTAGALTAVSPTAGSYGIVLTVTDSGGLRAYMPLSLTVYPGAAPGAGNMWITVGSILPAATVGTAYPGGVTLTVLGGTATFAWAADTNTPFPAGLTLAAAGASPAITGTPTSIGLTGSLAAKLLSDAALQVTVPNTYVAKLGMLRMKVTTPTPGGGDSNEAQLAVFGPEPRILGVGNAASYLPGTVSAGELISIFGTGLGPATLAVYDPNFPAGLPQVLPGTGGTQVLFTVGANTYPAALIYTSAAQVGAMVPFEVAAAIAPPTPISMKMTYAGLTSKPYPLSVTSAVPGIFTADGSGKGQGAILNFNQATNDYTINSGSNPASLTGTPIVVLYVTGFGLTNPASDSWLPSPALPGSVDTVASASVTIGGKAATVASVVPPRSFPGLLQLNVTLPSDAPAGKAVPVTVSIGGATAQDGVTMALK